MKTTFLFLALFILIIPGCSLFEDNRDENVTGGEKSAQLIEADNEFGLELFQKIRQSDNNENIMVSPLSVSVALAMAYNGASGETKAEMEKTLKLNGLTTSQINDTYKTLISAIQSSDENVVFEIANSIFYRQGFPFKQNFTDINESVYNAEVSGLNFNLPEAVTTINNWVAEKTHDKIPTIINQINPLDVMILINAVYFNGIWQEKFEQEGTHNLPFTKEDGTVIQVPMMNKTEKLEYASNDLFRAVKIPYGKGQYNMVVMLPVNGITSKNVISSFTFEKWGAWMKSFSIQNKVDVTLPRFKFEFETGLNSILSAMGMEKAFLPGLADFSGISDEKIYISSVKHKSYIDVNETGTEAAAVTSIIFTTTGEVIPDPEVIYFTVDKPFVFAITENDTGAILFIGEVANPVYPL